MVKGDKFLEGLSKTKATRIMSEHSDHRNMILYPELWPQWPFLPVKRWIENELECGVIWIPTGFNIYICNLYMMPKTTEEFKALKHYTYTNVDDLLADKWVVD